MERRCIENSQSIYFMLKCTLSKSIHLFTYLSSILRWLLLLKITSTLCQIWQLITSLLQKNIYFCFIEYAKAFDCVDHNKLEVLKEMGIPDRLTCLLRSLYTGEEAQLELDMEQQTGSK